MLSSPRRNYLQPIADASVDASEFEYIRTLGASATGEILVARKADTGQVHTVKLVRKSGHNADGLATRIRREQKILQVLTECRVPFVVTLFWSFEDGRAMYLVIDRTDERNLRNAVEKQGPLLAHEAICCAAELAEGISGLHALGIVHAQLMPESILVAEDGHILISDFDDASFLSDDAERLLVAQHRPSLDSQEYLAPELILGWEYDYAVDWWSFGLVVFWILTGTHPFVRQSDAGHPEIIRAKVLHAELTHDHLGMSEDAYGLISRCCQRNPALRIDGLGVKMHQYFSTMSVPSQLVICSSTIITDLCVLQNLGRCRHEEARR
ncbi:kinase-like protein [Pilatotrama ljubarskyi]|nr:kinase-like protein [Pilatotrama ljubarskyi]